VNTMNVKQRILELFKQSAAPGVPISLRKACEDKTKLFVGLLMAVIFWSVPTLAQEKNELGLVIGGIVTLSQTLSPGANLVIPAGTLPNSNITFNSWGVRKTKAYWLMTSEGQQYFYLQLAVGTGSFARGQDG
jgi:hypothetical protein